MGGYIQEGVVTYRRGGHIQGGGVVTHGHTQDLGGGYIREGDVNVMLHVITCICNPRRGGY